MTDTAKRARPRVWETPELPLADHIPEFASDEEAAEFFDTHDISGIWDQLEDVTNDPPWVYLRDDSRPAGSRARKRPPNGRMDLVSLRLPAEMIDEVKAVAARQDRPYQALIRTWIAERLDREQAGVNSGQRAPGSDA